MSDFKLNPNFKHSIVSEKDIKNQDDVVQHNPAEIADPDCLIKNVLRAIEIMDTDDMIKLQEESYPRFMNKVIDEIPDIQTSMIKILSDRQNRVQNLERILQIIETLRKVKFGNLNMESAYANFVEEQNEKYIYPQFGGKKEFEQKYKKINKE
jgi:glucosamine 6-phosphate synthetase-like amidotransferase/phosphosugar isomerase protein